MQQELTHDRATLDAGVRPHDAAQRHGLQAQDHLAEPVAESLSAEIVGSVIDCFLVDVHNAG